MTNLEKDTTITVESYKIANYKTRTGAYEGHYPHYNTQCEYCQKKKSTFGKGDYIILHKSTWL